MLCCIRRTKPVEKNEEADEKMEQEANKPEDKAHKAATKIQASFRGHIIRKKLKSEKKEDSPAAQDEKKKTSPVAESAAEPTENSKATSQAKSPSADETTNTPATISSTPADAPTSEPRKEQVKQEAGLNTTESKELENVVVAEEGEDKISSPTANENTTANECPESAQSLKPVEGKDKEEPKQANVPAANDSETIEDQAQSIGTESDQPQDQKDAVEESKPTENSHSEAGKEEDKADQDKI